MSESEVVTKSKKAQVASRKLAIVPTKAKNKALEEIGKALESKAKEIIEANKIDLEAGEKKGMSRSQLDRLAIDGKRIKSMVEALNVVEKLPDPVGEVINEWTRPNGLKIKKVRVPLGVIAIIYEARPNVTVDAAGLCLKTGNATVLRGSSSAINSNIAIVEVISEAAYNAGIPEGSIQLIEDTKREAVNELLKLNKYIDVVIPRGNADLIKMVVKNSTVPVIETGAGNCHLYVEKTADLKMAEEITLNAKTSRPSVCNAIETLLVDEAVAGKFLPAVIKKLKSAGVELRGDEKVKAIDPSVKAAIEEDWGTEYCALILAVAVVSGIDEAIKHIIKYSTKHTEAIITADKAKAKKFTEEIDSAAVFVNASTRFSDGFEFGFGAEIGISTQKLHARGPMGLPELTSYKYIIHGDGQVRTL